MSSSQQPITLMPSCRTSDREDQRGNGQVFLPYLLRVTDTKAEYKFRNLAFPYRQPGSDTIEGFELRGFKGFKMKAEGTNSSTAAWIADFSDGHPDSVRHVFFAESGYDAMAFYQVNRSRIDLPSSVFVSTGGSFSNMQIRKVSDYYAHARYWDCFDNDKAGILYGIRMEALMNRIMLNIVTTDEGAIIEHRGIKTVRLADEDLSLNRVANEFHLSRHVSVWKAPKDYKDWNDVTMNKPLSPGLHRRRNSSVTTICGKSEKTSDKLQEQGIP